MSQSVEAHEDIVRLIQRNLSGREILVQTFGGSLINVQDTTGYYDPLQYLILFPFGTYGWDINTCDANRSKVSCRDYYAYIF